MAQKIKVGAVSYLNTRPLVYGFEKGMMQDEIVLSFDYPANVARQLLNDEIDVGLVPVAVLPLLKEYHIIPGYCIGANGAVASVCLFSDVPLEEITEILLDYQSRTSVALLKVLLKEYWKLDVKLVPAEKGFEDLVKGKTAGLVIGDRAFEQRKKSTYIYDLADVWKQMTGLPFVFAVWASNKKMSVPFQEGFTKACAEGVNRLELFFDIAAPGGYNLTTYFTENVSYPLDEDKKKGLDIFLKFISSNLQNQTT